MTWTAGSLPPELTAILAAGRRRRCTRDRRTDTRQWDHRDVSSFVHVDDPDSVINWFASYPEAERRRTPTSHCPHNCRHLQTAVVGYGPDLKHYELIVCEDRDGCDRNCRAWLPTDDNAHGGIGGPTYRHAIFHPDMRQLGPVDA